MIISIGSAEEHNKLVHEAAQRLYDEGFSLKLSKCEFTVKEIVWFGYELSRTGVKPKHSKIQDILALKPPNSLKKLRQFIDKPVDEIHS